ncbi:MAG: dihydroorotate dehydrogenase electron transfer subunit [bacterium]|nr:dihydroorotate dehydrogenase electron transfer subunit [Candidatus Margulisiibacteriota bacterium]
MPKQEKVKIIDHQQVGSLYFKLTLFSDYISTNAKPGQFVQVKCSDGYDPLLRRPLSIHRVNKLEKTFQLLYEIVGKGTDLLSQKCKEEELDVLGPLGNGFDLSKVKDSAILVGGGMGVAPLLFLAEELKKKAESHAYRQAGRTQNTGIQILIGASSKDCLVCLDEFKQITDKVQISTDDGSCGEKCFVSDLLKNLTPDTSHPTPIFACGPKPMLQTIAKITPCQVSMEARMACGIGTCLGCVVKTKSGFKKVCKDGPVFDSEEILFS